MLDKADELVSRMKELGDEITAFGRKYADEAESGGLESGYAQQIIGIGNYLVRDAYKLRDSTSNVRYQQKKREEFETKEDKK